MLTLLCLVVKLGAHAQGPPGPTVNAAASWSVVQEITRGDGITVASGDTVTFEFRAKLASGKIVANTVARGLAYTLKADQNGDALASALVGMHETGEREITLTYAFPGVPGIVPAGEPMLIWLKIDTVTPEHISQK